MIILIYIILTFYSLVLAGLEGIRGRGESALAWVACAFLFFIGYSTTWNAAGVYYFTSQTEFLLSMGLVKWEW